MTWTEAERNFRRVFYPRREAHQKSKWKNKNKNKRGGVEVKNMSALKYCKNSQELSVKENKFLKGQLKPSSKVLKSGQL